MSAYGWNTASAVVRPNITSSFEKPNTNPSARSISTTSTSSPSSSDNRVVSSRPPNPAPSTTTRMPFPRRTTPTQDATTGSGAELGVEGLEALVHLADQVAHLVGGLVDALAGLGVEPLDRGVALERA